MTDSRTKERILRLCGVLAFTLLIVLIPALRFDFYYDLNDDTAIKDILSGAYTGSPSGYCIQMMFPLSWLIAVCYAAIPEVPWYGLFLCVCQFGAVSLIAYRLLNIMKSRLTRALSLAALAAIALGLFMRELVIIQYSVTSGFCMACASFLFITCEQTQTVSLFLKRNIVPAFLVLLSFMIRSEVCLMLMPFLLLAGLVKWGGEEKVFTSKNIRKYLILIGAAILGMFAVLGVDKVAYSASDWSNFRHFFDARTRLYDFYGIPPYDEGENEEFYSSIGLSRESYALLENYNFALDDSIDSWLLDSISEYRRQQVREGADLHYTLGFVSKNSIGGALWLYKEQLLSNLGALGGVFTSEDYAGNDVFARRVVIGGYAMAGAYAVYVLICFLPQKGREKARILLKIAALLVIRSVLWIYLYMVDRAINRVTMSLLLAELAVLAGFMLNDYQKMEKQQGSRAGFFGNMTNAVICVLGIMFLGVAFVNNYKAVSAEYSARLEADGRWGALMQYCRSHSENYYVIDVYSSTSYEGAPYSEKIFRNTDDSYKNFDICGGWAAKSPLYRQKLAKAGIKDIQSALRYSRYKTYFVAAKDKDLSWLSCYYEKRGILAKPVETDTVMTANGEGAFTVYALK